MAIKDYINKWTYFNSFIDFKMHHFLDDVKNKYPQINIENKG